MKSSLLVTLSFFILFNGCKSKPSITDAEKESSPKTIDSVITGPRTKFKGNWLCKDYLAALSLKRNSDNIDVATQKPDVWELIFEDSKIDSVIAYADGSRQHLPVKYYGSDSLSIQLRNGKTLFLLMINTLII